MRELAAPAGRARELVRMKKPGAAASRQNTHHNTNLEYRTDFATELVLDDHNFKETMFHITSTN